MSKDKQGTDSVDVAAQDITPEEITAQWADDYEAGAELFVGAFTAEDFDTFYGTGDYPDGATIAVLRCMERPTPGWIRKHAHMNDLERTFALLEMHACDKALEILDSLKDEPWNEFIIRWGEDGGLVEGKSRRFSRRRAR